VAFIWMGDEISTDITPDLIVSSDQQRDDTAPLKMLLQQMGVIFRAW
jgi:hypothetical protein